MTTLVDDLSFIVTALSESSRERTVSALRMVADQLEKGELVQASGGIHLDGSPDEGFITLMSNLHLRKPALFN